MSLRKLLKAQATVEVCLGSPVPDRRALPSCGRGSQGVGVEKLQKERSRANGLLLGIRNTTDVQLVHLVLECCSFQSQALCRSALAGDSSAGSSQSSDDDLPLSLFES